MDQRDVHDEGREPALSSSASVATNIEYASARKGRNSPDKGGALKVRLKWVRDTVQRWGKQPTPAIKP